MKLPNQREEQLFQEIDQLRAVIREKDQTINRMADELADFRLQAMRRRTCHNGDTTHRAE